MIINLVDTKLKIKTTSNFKKQLKNVAKQGKDIDKLIYVVNMLANCEKLDRKYKNHQLNNDKYYKNCYECHIESDWLLVYQHQNDKLVLLLIATGSHSSIFK